MPTSRKFLESPDRTPLPGQRSFTELIDAGTRYIGMDPGASGGIAVIDVGANGTSVSLHTLGNSTDKQTTEFLRFVRSPCRAAIEKNSGYVGGVGNTGSTMFVFGRSTGKLLGYLVALGIPHEEVTPRTWQKALGIPPRKKTESKAQFKRRLRHRAEQLFPEARVTLATADALLIAEFCRRKREGLL